MKTIKKITAVAALLAFPLAASAQMTWQTDQQTSQQMNQQANPQMDTQMNAQMPTPANDSLSRSQVYHDMVQMRRVGYVTGRGDKTSYPREAQAAEARVGAMELQQSGESQYGYGGVAVGTSASGGPGEQVMQPAHVGNGQQEPVYFSR